MSKRKPTEQAPTHIAEWSAAHPFAAAEAFADRVREDARADVAMGKPIEDARLIARGLAHDEGSRKPRRPDIDEWIRKQLAADPTLKRPELWERAPQWIKDQLGPDRFLKRVTKVRQGR